MPPYMVGPVSFGLFGYYLGKNMFSSDFERQQAAKFTFLCFKMNGNQLLLYELYEIIFKLVILRQIGTI